VVNIIDDPDGYTVHRWPRYGTRIRWIIVHDPAADRARPEAILRVLRRNSTGASYNELIYRPTGGGEPESHVLSDPSEYVGHAGAQTRIPKTAVRNGAVNRTTWGLSVCTYGRSIERTDPDLWDGLVRLIAHRIRQFELPDAGVALAHREVSTTPGRRTDPRGISMDYLRAAVAERLAQS